MLNNCIEFFAELDNKEDFILEDYRLNLGNYYFVDYNTGKVIADLEVDSWTQEKTNLYRQFQIRDYLSSLIDINKPMDKHKQIHSNNYLSFYIKKEKLEADLDKVERSIQECYKVYGDYSKKYDKKKMKILDGLELEEREGRQEELDKIYQWQLDNYKSLTKLPHFKQDKNYLKIFFVPGPEALEESSKEDIEKYKKEAKKYIMPNLYNNSKDIKDLEDTIYGPPSYNFNLNNKKPFLKNKTRKTEVPFLFDLEEAYNNYLFFKWLETVAITGKRNIYLGEIGNKKVIKALPDGEALEEKDFLGIFIRLDLTKYGVEILDIDGINTAIDPEEMFQFENHLDVREHLLVDALNPKEPVNRWEAIRILDSSLFSGKLIKNLYKEPDNSDMDLKFAILDIKDTIINWYYKNKPMDSNNQFAKITEDMVVKHLGNNHHPSMVNGYNTRRTFLNKLEQ